MGSVMFADNSGGQVQLLYFPLLTDLEAASQYSWGSATLAFLYRQLYRATEREKVEIVGPVILLHLWAWEHIPIGRPRCIIPLGEGDDHNAVQMAIRQEKRKKTGYGSQPPLFSGRFVDGEDSLV